MVKTALFHRSLPVLHPMLIASIHPMRVVPLAGTQATDDCIPTAFDVHHWNVRDDRGAEHGDVERHPSQD